MLKPANAKTVILLVLSVAIVAPLFLVDKGFALVVPIVAIFWLDGLAKALGFTVSVNGGVDAFNLVPPNTLGTLLILLGSAASLGALYMMARRLLSGDAKRQARAEGVRP
jgi:hypothetical protein